MDISAVNGSVLVTIHTSESEDGDLTLELSPSDAATMAQKILAASSLASAPPDQTQRRIALTTKARAGLASPAADK